VAFVRLTVRASSTVFTIVNEIQLSRPELAFIIATRAILGVEIALLLADRLSAEQQKAVGSTFRPSRTGYDNSCRLGDFRQVRVKSVQGDQHTWEYCCRVASRLRD
jgi:hypothetical protein